MEINTFIDKLEDNPEAKASEMSWYEIKQNKGKANSDEKIEIDKFSDVLKNYLEARANGMSYYHLGGTVA